MLEYLSKRKVNYNKKIYDGTKPVCVVTPVQFCVRDLELVKEHQIIEKYEEATGT